jgi:iron(III) transport system substrate-binding protein
MFTHYSVRLTALVLSLSSLMLVAGCNSKTQTGKSEETSTPSVVAQKTGVDPQKLVKATSVGPLELVVYSGRSAGLIEPLLKKFETETGIKVKTRFDKSTQALANRIAREGKQGEADVFFAQDSGYLGALANAGHLQPLSPKTLSKVSKQFRDATGKWIATSGRARVLVYSPERVKTAELPKNLDELASDHWAGRLGWAPSNSSYQAHVSALRSLWGEEKTKSWLTRMAALKPKVYPKNSPQVKAVSNGEIDVGWVNHYYLHKIKAANPTLKAANYSFTTAGDAGNLLMLSGVAMTTHAKNKAAAQTLIDYLVSEGAQKYFAQKLYEYPVVAGIKTHPDVPPKQGGWAVVEQSALADVVGTVKLLRSLKLQ